MRLCPVVLGSVCPDNRVVRLAHAYLVLGANHAERFNTSDFGALYGELLVAVVKDTYQSMRLRKATAGK